MLSQPSKPTFIFDVLDLADLSGTFYYNFYTVDEYVATEPVGDTAINLKKVPRYIQLRWNYTTSYISRLNAGNLISGSPTLINDESNVVSGNEVKLSIHDVGIYNRLTSTLVSYAILNRPYDQLKNYSTIQLLRGITSELDPSLQVGFEQYFAIANSAATNVETFSINLSKDHASTIIANSMIDPLCPFTTELQTAQSLLPNKNVNANSKPNFGDYIPNIKTVVLSDSIASSFTDSDDTQIFHIGYKIIRSETDVNGVEKQSQKTFLVTNPNQNYINDLDVRYGSTYNYKISPIFLLSFNQVQENGSSAKKFAMVSATPSKPALVKAIDNKKADPPIDIHFYWDYEKANLFFSWSYPPSHENKIAKLQILRRATIDDPFVLIKEFDFDNTIRIDNPFNDVAVRNSYSKVNEKVGIYVDETFKINSKYIYALCCVDAHGISSTLSSQFEIIFDRFQSNIVKKLISHQGALKAYPNMFLEADLFVDLLKDSHHGSMELYFNPEVQNIVFGAGENKQRSEKAFLTDDSGQYKILTINSDLQKTAVTTVKIAAPISAVKSATSNFVSNKITRLI